MTEGATNDIGGIGLELTLDTRQFDAAIESAQNKLQALGGGSSSRSVPLRGGAAGESVDVGGASARVRPVFAVNRDTVHGMSVDINRHLRALTAQSGGVKVPVTLGRSNWAQIRSEISRNIGAVPITITLGGAGKGGSGGQSMQLGDAFAGVVAAIRGTSISDARGFLRSGLASRGVTAQPRKYGGPVVPRTRYLVGEEGPEEVEFTQPGRVIPHASRGRRPVTVDWRTQPDWRYAEMTQDISTKLLMRMRDIDRDVRPRGPRHVEELMDSMRQRGYDRSHPVSVIYDPVRHAAFVGEGNHRVSAANRLGMRRVPAQVEILQTAGHREALGDEHNWTKLPGQPVQPDDTGYMPRSLPPRWLGMRIRGGKVRGYGGKYGASRPYVGHGFGDPAWRRITTDPEYMHHGTYAGSDIRGGGERGTGIAPTSYNWMARNAHDSGLDPSSAAMWRRKWRGPQGRVSFWASSADHVGQYAGSVLRTPASGTPFSQGFDYDLPEGGPLHVTDRRVPLRRLQYWGEDEQWHRFRRGRRRGDGGPAEPMGPLQRRLAGLPPLERRATEPPTEVFEPEWLRRAREKKLPPKSFRQTGGPIYAMAGAAPTGGSKLPATWQAYGHEISRSAVRPILRNYEAMVDYALSNHGDLAAYAGNIWYPGRRRHLLEEADAAGALPRGRGFGPFLHAARAVIPAAAAASPGLYDYKAVAWSRLMSHAAADPALLSQILTTASPEAVRAVMAGVKRGGIPRELAAMSVMSEPLMGEKLSAGRYGWEGIKKGWQIAQGANWRQILATSDKVLPFNRNLYGNEWLRTIDSHDFDIAGGGTRLGRRLEESKFGNLGPTRAYPQGRPSAARAHVLEAARLSQEMHADIWPTTRRHQAGLWVPHFPITGQPIEASLTGLVTPKGWRGREPAGWVTDPVTNLFRPRMAGGPAHAAAGVFASAMRPSVGHPTTIAGAQRIWNREPRLQFLERDLPRLLEAAGYEIDKVLPLFGGYLGDIERSNYFGAGRMSLRQLREVAALAGRQGQRGIEQQEATLLSISGPEDLRRFGVSPNGRFYTSSFPATGLKDLEAVRSRIVGNELAGGFSMLKPTGGMSKLMFSLRDAEIDDFGGDAATLRRLGELGLSFKGRPAHIEALERTIGAAPYLDPFGSYGQVGRRGSPDMRLAQRLIHRRIMGMRMAGGPAQHGSAPEDYEPYNALFVERSFREAMQPDVGHAIAAEVNRIAGKYGIYGMTTLAAPATPRELGVSSWRSPDGGMTEALTAPDKMLFNPEVGSRKYWDAAARTAAFERQLYGISETLIPTPRGLASHEAGHLVTFRTGAAPWEWLDQHTKSQRMPMPSLYAFHSARAGWTPPPELPYAEYLAELFSNAEINQRDPHGIMEMLLRNPGMRQLPPWLGQTDIDKFLGSNISRLSRRKQMQPVLPVSVSDQQRELALRALGMHAAGGPEDAKGLYIVGEVGKELFVPRRLEYLIPQDVMAAIPKKKQGGIVEVGQQPYSLFAPPEDGWIIPNKFIGRIPHAATGRSPYSSADISRLIAAAGNTRTTPEDLLGMRGDPGAEREFKRAFEQTTGLAQMGLVGAAGAIPARSSTRAMFGAIGIRKFGGLQQQLNIARARQAETEYAETLRGAGPILSGAPARQQALAEAKARLTQIPLDRAAAEARRAGATRPATATLDVMRAAERRGATDADKAAWTSLRGTLSKSEKTWIAANKEVMALTREVPRTERAIAKLTPAVEMDLKVQQDLTKAKDDYLAATKKAQVGLSGTIKGMIGGAASMQLYVMLAQAGQLAVEELGKAAGPVVDSLMGFKAAATNASKMIGERIVESGGNVEKAFAEVAQNAGLGADSMAFVRKSYEASATAIAGQTVEARGADLWRGAMSVGAAAPRGLYGGYGGVGDTGFGAQLLGGAAGFAETVGGNFAAGNRSYLVNNNIAAAGGQSMGIMQTAGLRPVGDNSGPKNLGELWDAFWAGPQMITQAGANMAGGALQYPLQMPDQIGLTAKNEQIATGQEAYAAHLTDLFSRAALHEGRGTADFRVAGGVGRAGETRTPEQERRVASFMEAARGTGDQAAIDAAQNMVDAGYVIEDSMKHVVADSYTFQKAWETMAKGATLTDPKVYAAQLAQGLGAGFKAQAEQTRYAIDTRIPAQMGEQLAAQPILKGRTGVLGTGGQRSFLGGSSGAVNEAIAEADKLRKELSTAGKAAIEQQAQWIEEQAKGNPELAGAADEYRGFMKEVTASGKTIAKLQTQIANAQTNANLVAYANNMRLANRAIADARGLAGQGGSRYGQLQREQTMLGFGLQQRQITTQIALANFQAPGETGEERYARRKEELTKARIAQRQLDIGKSLFGIEAGRGVTDTSAAKNVMQAQHEAAQLTAAVSKRIANEQLKQSQSMQKAGQVVQQAEGTFSNKLQQASSFVAEFGGTLQAAAQAIADAFNLQTRQSKEDSGRWGHGGHARGIVGMAKGPTRALMGEAGDEAVAILRNPRAADLGMVGGGTGGGGTGGGSFTANININASVRGDSDIHAIANAVERVLGKKAQLLGYRSPSY